MWRWFHKWGSPKWFYETAGRWIPWLSVCSGLLFLVGLPLALVFSPMDYQQGNTVRIMYIHVPAAYLSMSCYALMAVAGAIGLVWKMKLSHMVASACAPIGAAFTFLALFTGAVWGKPTWGAWWVWDARLTSELVLLFLYFGFIALDHAIADRKAADKATAVLSLVGIVNLPIIHYSVVWWNTLHQGSTVTTGLMDVSMRWPFFTMLAAFQVLFIALLFMATRNQILKREKRARWTAQLAQGEV